MGERITQVRCIMPFTKLIVRKHGDCYSCCPEWIKAGSAGRLTGSNSLMEIWNSQKMQDIRQAILDDQLERVCHMKNCPIALNKKYLNLEAMKNDDPHFNQIIAEIMAGRTIMDQAPYIFEIGNSAKCNLDCIMCQINHRVPEDDDLIDQILYTKALPEILPRISRIYLVSHGEVFFNPYSRKLLQTLESDRYPALKIQLLTNGLLFTPKLWETIRHNRYESIAVSIDAASAETYQKIRRHGNWTVLRRNLDFISQLRAQNIFTHFSINFCVMKSNYHEIKDFVEMGLSLGCDKIEFQKIFGEGDIPENINLTRNKRAFQTIARLLEDPIFSRPEVDTTMLEEYRKYGDQVVHFWEDWLTKLFEHKPYTE